MVVTLDPRMVIFTVSVIYATLYVLSGFANLLTITLTMPVYLFFGKNNSETEHESNPLVSFVVEVVLRLLETVSGFVVQGFLLILRTTYMLLPVLIMIVLMSILNANLDTALPVLVQAYNVFVARTNAIGMIRRLAWILKISFEILTPIYNWGIETINNSWTDVLRLLVDNDHNRAQIMSIVQEIGVLFATLTKVVVSWLTINVNECQHVNILADLRAIKQNPLQTTPLQHQCFDFDYLDMDLSTAITVSQKIVTISHSLSTSLCPAVASVSAVLLYPLYDANMGEILQNVANMFLGIFYTAQVTQVRCRAAFALSLSSTLCVPDFFPMFRYAERISLSSGHLADNWLNVAHMMLLSFFMDRDAEVFEKCTTSAHTVASVSSDSMFGQRATRLLSATTSLLAVTDGTDVIYLHKKDSIPPKRVQAAFRDSVNVEYGVASIDFAASLLQTDDNGDSKTGILGCKCVDDHAGPNTGLEIVCNVALYPAFFDVDTQIEETQTRIPLLFERGSSALLLKCRFLRISVQSVRFPSQVFDVRKQAATGAPSYNHDTYSECMTDPRKCNNIDALVYVMPLCPRYDSQRDRLAADSAEGDQEFVECIKDSKYQTCFPYCVALHQKGAGNSPMTLYRKRTLTSGGVYMANTKIAMTASAAAASGNPETSVAAKVQSCTVSSQHELLTDITPTYCSTQMESPTASKIYSNSDNSVIMSAMQCTTSDEICPDDPSAGAGMSAPTRSIVLSDSQPFLFAGDLILAQQCTLDNAECMWTTELSRITSDIHSQYSIVNKMDNIPSILTSNSRVKSEHGGVILPGV
jgi:hypothetical protein